MNCLNTKTLCVAGLAALMVACLGEPGGGPRDVQKLTGSVESQSFGSPVLGVRVVQGTSVVAIAPVAADGSFAIEVPAGADYRLEVVTRAGAHPLGARAGTGLRTMAFDVCDAAEEFDVGEIHLYGGDEADGEGGDGEPGDPSDPDDGWPPDGDPGDGDCGEPPPDPCLEDPALCDPCLEHPEWCEDPCDSDPDACVDPCEADPSLCECPPGSEPGPDGTCWPPECMEDPALCDPCLAHPEWCEDPCDSDPDGCVPPEPPPCDEAPGMCDPCLDDPDSCWPEDPSCPYDDPACWPEPPECDDGMVPGDPGPDGDWCWPEDDGCYSDVELPDFGCE